MKINRGEIRYGDRVYARLELGGRVLKEIMLDKVSGMTEILAELRRDLNIRRGLARVTVRNHSRGWTSERPLMLYGGSHTEQRLRRAAATASAQPAAIGGRPHMTFPWETH